MPTQPDWIGQSNPIDGQPEDVTECTDCEKVVPTNDIYMVEEYINGGYIKIPYCGICLSNRVADMLVYDDYEATHEETEGELIIKIKRK